MRTALHVAVLFTLGAGGLAALGGCELQNCPAGQNKSGGTCVVAKSLKTWQGTAETKTATWQSGGSVTIRSINGELDVVQGGAAGEVTATFTPFVARAYDTPESEVRQDLAMLIATAQADASGNVTVQTSRQSGAVSTLGANVQVGLPSNFDGALDIQQSNGLVNLAFPGAPSSLTLSNTNGECKVAAGASASVNVNCANGDLSGSVSGVPAGSQGGSFSTGNGSISLSFPGSATFSVQAQATDGGKVDVTNPPAGCTVNAASDSAKTVSCGGATSADPVFKVTASGTALADVTLSF